MVGAIFVFSLLYSRAPYLPEGVPLHTSGTLAFVADTQGTPLDHQGLEIRDLALLGTM